MLSTGTEKCTGIRKRKVRQCDGAFAALCGASPIPVSSGRRDRYRINHGGDRDANRTLHMISVCRLRHCQRTRAYAQRRLAEGKTTREIIRCLKRYIARELFHTLSADLADLNRPAPSRAAPAIAVSINCGAGPTARNRRRA
jgi:hypothetical protein